MFLAKDTEGRLLLLILLSQIFAILFMKHETNRIPSDLPEPEPESVAGFMTEYSSIYYSIIVLTEYTNIIALILCMLTMYALPSEI